MRQPPQLIEEHGIIQGWFGYQTSPAAWEILKPLLPWPYYRWVKIELPQL